MKQRPQPLPADEALLIDAIQGELDPAERRALEARLAREPELARAHARWEALARAEQGAFEPADTQAAAVRVAAWVRDAARRDETAARARVARRPARVRGWTRILAWSVAAHVVVLGVLAFLLRSAPSPAKQGGGAFALVDSGSGRAGSDDDGVEFDHNIACYESLVHRDLGARFDELAMIEQEDLSELPDDLEKLLHDAPVAWGERTHPVGVVVPMTRRRVEGLKRRRMRLLGYNAEGTLAAVDKGLGFLANRQAADGSFPPAKGDTATGQTALALLAFLGEGHSSQGHRDRDAVVRRGVQFLRERAFPKGTSDAGAGIPDVASLAPVTIALSEDYMLGYGGLTLAQGERRTAEIGVLARQVRAALDQGRATAHALPASTRTWLLWALDATERAGVTRQSDAERAAFRTWVASTASADASARADTAEQALMAGTALLYTERGAAKPRFTSWSKANVEQLVDRLDPRGGARGDDPVADTARILLALQVAYRTY